MSGHGRLGKGATFIRPRGRSDPEDEPDGGETQEGEGRHLALQEAVRGHPQFSKDIRSVTFANVFSFLSLVCCRV